MSPFVIKIIAGAMLAGLLAWGVHHIQSAFAERNALRVTTAQQSETIGRFEQHAKDETESAKRLTGIYDKLDGNAQKLLDAIHAGPLTHPVTHQEKDSAGNLQTFTCDERDPARYWLLFNAAIDGTDAPAPGVSDRVPRQ